MADIFIVKRRLKFSLQVLAVGGVLSALASWYFWSQLDYADDRSSFLMSAVVTGALALGWVGLLLFYIAAKRLNPVHNRTLTDRIDEQPWWRVGVVLLLGIITVAGYGLVRLSVMAESEFDLLREGQLTLLEERLSANPILLERLDGKGGVTLVQVAYRENYPKALSRLLALGASSEEMDAQGRSPIVVSLENPPMLGTLLDAGFDPNLPDAEGVPPIHYAVVIHSTNAVVLLVEAGAKIDARTRGAQTPLMHALEADDLPMVGILLEYGADVDAFDQSGDTPLHKAVRRRNPDAIRLLIEQEADFKIFNFKHMTPLHLAARAGQLELVEIFLEHTKRVGLRDAADQTPFDHALAVRKYETADLLIEHGADINRIKIDGDTLLHKVILSRDYRSARFLIRAGADVYIPNEKGETALDIMRRKELFGLLDLVDERDDTDGL